ncbi:MAG: hypothetical protein SPD85_03615 [Candidatus Cryptobacteroides sp.]|nr:hypothetical protein [Candidatus Cryptobacteroides sp.]MDY4917528.1 hypothetical protein [Candidatus Cryptobacteroides sp.]
MDISEAASAYPSYAKSLLGIETDEHNGLNALHDETLCCGAAFTGALHAAQNN